MKCLLQRVSRCSVHIDKECVGRIETGLLALVAVEPDDTEQCVDRLLERVLGYRLFPDANQRMNLSLKDIGGGLMLVSQFTLAADTHKGMRPSFAHAAAPEMAEQLYDYLVASAQKQHSPVACGRFAANMQVELVNDGPVTILLETNTSV